VFSKKTTYLKLSAEPFLSYLDRWYSELPIVSMKSLLNEFAPEQTALFAIDVVNGFCREGNLSSPRVAKIVEPVAQLFRDADQMGIQNYVLSQDTHPSNSKEFQIYPPHCIEGTPESRTVRELTDLPNSRKFQVLPKRTINPGIERNLQEWMERHDNIRQFIVTGDCTDICVYLMSIYLKSRSVQQDVSYQIVVPANCVDTYDVPVETAEEADILPHPGDFLHRVFLYHMALNGVRVVAEIA
jgi:nicotinamidase-related amidase